jgi:methionyl-tRNA formyltransferase
MAQIHLFSTDSSALDLIDGLHVDDVVTAIVVPSNRLGSEKVRRLEDEAVGRGLPVIEHPRGGLLPVLPPATAGISWLYSQLIAAEDLARYPVGILNMHGGKIPEYRGQNVLLWAIANGEDELGITWHEICKDVDAGPIWYERMIPIPANATAADMRGAMISTGLEMFPAAWTRFKSRLGSPRYPDLGSGHVWPRRQ